MDEVLVALMDKAGHDEGYAIRCPATGYWRAVEPIDSDLAWTMDVGKRAVWVYEADARRALEAIWNWRSKRATEGGVTCGPGGQRASDDSSSMPRGTTYRAGSSCRRGPGHSASWLPAHGTRPCGSG
jgi:hypothetical protein